MTAVTMHPIGTVVSPRTDLRDDDWGQVEATIALDATRLGSDAVVGLEQFSHLEVIFVFDRVAAVDIHLGARHPRGRTDWPAVGILAQRAKARPNRLGVSRCALIAVDGLTLRVRGLDAIDGTPVLDVKPYFAEFGPRGPVHQPAWSHALMTDYYR